jgi:hypothetical protein
VKAASIFLLFGVVVFAAKKPIAWERATVVSQKLDSAKLAARCTLVGNYCGPLTPINVRISLVEIDTTKLRYTLMEPYGKKAGVLRRPHSASPLMFAVNSDVRFYRDSDGLIFIDGHKKHHLQVVGTASLQTH